MTRMGKGVRWWGWRTTLYPEWLPRVVLPRRKTGTGGLGSAGLLSGGGGGQRAQATGLVSGLPLS